MATKTKKSTVVKSKNVSINDGYASGTPAPNPTTMVPDMARMRTIAAQVKMMSDATRLAIAMMLLDSPRIAVNVMVAALPGSSQPAISHHLSLMRHSSVVFPVRNGKNNHYELTPKGIVLARMVKKLADQT